MARRLGQACAHKYIHTGTGMQQRYMCTYIAGIEDVSFSEGTISACISAISAHEDGPVLALPNEQPITFDDDDLREFRSPVRPCPPDDTEYGRLDAILTQRSTLWTSFLPPPLTDNGAHHTAYIDGSVCQHRRDWQPYRRGRRADVSCQNHTYHAGSNHQAPGRRHAAQDLGLAKTQARNA